MKLENILVATDLSPSSEPANRWAAALATRFDSRITVLNVDEASQFEWPARSLQGAIRLKQLLGELARRRKTQLEEIASWFEDQDVPASTESVVGRASDQILEHSQSRDVDLVIMGKRGTRLKERFTLGSTTRRVLRQSRVPTLVVPRGDPSDDEPEELLQGKRIIATTSFSAACLMALDVTLELANSLDAQVDYVHVIRLPVPFSVKPDEWFNYLSAATREELEHMRIKDLTEQIGEERAKRCTPTTTLGVSVSESIRDLAVETGADLVAIPSHRSSPRLGGTARRSVRRSRVPVLVYPVRYLKARVDLAREEGDLV